MNLCRVLLPGFFKATQIGQLLKTVAAAPLISSSGLLRLQTKKNKAAAAFCRRGRRKKRHVYERFAVKERATLMRSLSFFL